MDNNYCLILAGGNGSRLWPVSRTTRPKQFMDLLGTGRTMLQQTYDRIARFIDPSHIYLSTNVDYLPLVHEQLPEVDDAHILEEPVRRGTLAAVAWGTVVIAKKNLQANILVTPSDHIIVGEDDYRRDLLAGLDFVSRHEKLLVTGIKPSRPETGYGYIQIDDGHVEAPGIYTVKSFTEKPDATFAQMFIDEGDFLWNAGLDFFNVNVMLSNLYRLVPEYQVEIPRMMAEAESSVPTLVPEFFSLFVDAPSDAQGNVLLPTPAFLYDCQNNVIRLPNGRTAVVKGLQDYVIAEEGEILMICPRGDVTSMRRMHIDTKFS